MDAKGAFDAMWRDIEELAGAGVFAVAVALFLTLPLAAATLLWRSGDKRPLGALVVWSWFTGWWFLQHAIDPWTNPGGAATTALLLLVVLVGWSLVGWALLRRAARQRVEE